MMVQPLEIPTKALPNATITVGLGFDKKIDMDLSCFVYDEIGNLLDIIYFNNLKTSNGSISHSGDSTKGENSGDSEQVTMKLSFVPIDISVLIFAVTIQTPNKTFGQTENSYFRCFNDLDKDIVNYPFGRSNFPSMIACMIFRDPTNFDSWLLRPVMSGSHKKGLDQIAPDLDTALLTVIPQSNLSQRTINVANKMDLNKGDDFLIDSDSVVMGLSWDAGCDLDAWCYMFTADWVRTDEIGFSELTSKCGSVVHSGDARNGDAVGDDESISVNLSKVPKDVKYLFFVVKIFTFLTSTTFDQVKNPAVRMLDQDNKELAYYRITDVAAHATALVFGKIYRMGNTWRFGAIGEGAKKKTVREAVTLSRFSGRPQKVILTIEKGRNLAPKDYSGKSDPYLVVHAFDHKFKSEKVLKTLDPDWKYEIPGVCWGGRLYVNITVWDWDKITRDDFMGQIEEDLRIGTEKWIPLKGRGKKEGISGDLFVTLKQL